MKTSLFVVAWCLLLALCWPIAIVAIVVWPFLWVLALPFRMIAVVCRVLLAFVSALLLLPARLLGYRTRSTGRAV